MPQEDPTSGPEDKRTSGPAKRPSGPAQRPSGPAQRPSPAAQKEKEKRRQERKTNAKEVEAKKKEKKSDKKHTDFPSPFAEGRQDPLIPVRGGLLRQAEAWQQQTTKETREKNDLGRLQLGSDPEAVVIRQAILIYLLREVVSKEDSDEDVVVNSTTHISGDEESGSDFNL
jgi:hypothetical protein